MLSAFARRLERWRKGRRLAAFRKKTGQNLRPGAEVRLLRLNDEIGFSGKRVLEIGGDLEGKLAKALVALGATHVTSINHDPVFASRALGPIEFRSMDVTELDLAKESFDLCIGFAVLEHIRDLPRALRLIHDVMRPGGRVVLHGGPLWYSRRGHHLLWEGPPPSRFSDKTNQIADWEHLLYEPAELPGVLATRGFPEEHANMMANLIYGSPLINRYAAGYIEQCFDDSPLAVVRRLDNKGPTPNQQQLELLVAKHDLPPREYSTASVEYLCAKGA